MRIDNDICPIKKTNKPGYGIWSQKLNEVKLLELSPFWHFPTLFRTERDRQLIEELMRSLKRRSAAKCVAEMADLEVAVKTWETFITRRLNQFAKKIEIVKWELFSEKMEDEKNEG